MHEDLVGFVREEGREYVLYLEMAGVSWCDGTYRIARTCSPVSVFEYVMEGRGTVTVDGRSFQAVKGDVYILHRGSNHCYFSDGADPWVKIWINIDGPLVDALVRAYGLQGVNHVRGLDIRDLLEEICRLARAGHGSPDDVFAQTALVFHRLVSRIHAFVHREEGARSREAAAMKLWLDRHVYERTSMAEIAAQVYKSPSQAIRIYRREYGVTPVDYLLGRRIETAKLLLCNTNLPVKEIAFRLHFADEHYFSNYFKKRTGVAPQYYRRGLWQTAGDGQNSGKQQQPVR